MNTPSNAVKEPIIWRKTSLKHFQRMVLPFPRCSLGCYPPGPLWWCTSGPTRSSDRSSSLPSRPSQRSTRDLRGWGHRHRWAPSGGRSPCRPGQEWTADSGARWNASRAAEIVWTFHNITRNIKITLNTLSILITRTSLSNLPARPMTSVSWAQLLVVIELLTILFIL